MVTTIGDVISEALELLAKSQMWLAEQVVVSPQAVTKWLQTGKISRENATDVARVLGISIDALLGGISPEGAKTGQVIDALPEESQQQVLDFILYQIDRNEGFFATEPKKAAHYSDMIDRIKADMAARRNPPAPKPKKRRKRRREDTK